MEIILVRQPILNLADIRPRFEHFKHRIERLCERKLYISVQDFAVDFWRQKMSEDRCKTIGDAARENSTLGQCTMPHWKRCGEIFTVPGGPGATGIAGNYDNYPNPHMQTELGWFPMAGWQYCKINCKMRVCCQLSANEAAYRKIMAEEMVKCLLGV